MKFTKPPYSPEELLDLLQQRGMEINDPDSAAFLLRTIGYYRFTGYALHFEEFDDRQRTHHFKPDTRFDDVVILYEFDDKLRTLLFDYVGHIEVAFRASLCNELALVTGNPHWYMDSELFNNQYNRWRELVESCKQESQSSKEIFIRSYKDKYHSPKLPPAWMVLEIMSMGVAAKFFADLKHKNYQKKVAHLFRLPPHHLISWIHTLVVLRNHCAHHHRIWNRNFSIRPTLTERQKKVIPSNTKLGAFLLIISDMLTSIGRSEAFQGDMITLIQGFPTVPLVKMGVTEALINELDWSILLEGEERT